MDYFDSVYNQAYRRVNLAADFALLSLLISQIYILQTQTQSESLPQSVSVGLFFTALVILIIVGVYTNDDFSILY